jgi:hypothetical protein
MLKKYSKVVKLRRFYNVNPNRPSEETGPNAKKWSDEDMQARFEEWKKQSEQKCQRTECITIEKCLQVKRVVVEKYRLMIFAIVRNKDMISGLWGCSFIICFVTFLLAEWYLEFGTWSKKSGKRLKRISEFSWSCIKFLSIVGIPFLFQAPKGGYLSHLDHPYGCGCPKCY